MRTALVLFHRDLRLADHAPLAHAAAAFDAVVPVFVWAPDEEAPWAPGGAHRWWLHHSLAALGAALDAAGSRLVLARGPTAGALVGLARETGAEAVLWHRAFEPALRARDRALTDALRAAGLAPRRFDGRLLHDPDALRTGTGGPYTVFAPFYRAFVDRVDVPAPLAAADLRGKAPAAWPASVPLDALGLLPTIPWDASFYDVWTPGEAAARARLEAFARDGLAAYATRRDAPAEDGSSALSPRLYWGEVSPRAVWHAAAGEGDGAASFRREVAWREFAYGLLWHRPDTPERPLKPAFDAFPWRDAPADLRAWGRGRTGYPYVDAGMRQLWATGWMPNRLRLATASFLVKHLLLPWQAGARWFWDTLVDADLANNTLNWQWVAGSGADAQPFFRILNPVAQAERFDPAGAYVRWWVPELAALETRHLHRPWEAPPDALRAAGVVLGETYPRPLVAHADGRARALAAFAAVRRAAA